MKDQTGQEIAVGQTVAISVETGLRIKASKGDSMTLRKHELLDKEGNVLKGEIDGFEFIHVEITAQEYKKLSSLPQWINCRFYSNAQNLLPNEVGSIGPIRCTLNKKENVIEALLTEFEGFLK
jgi:hypothetical protein